MLLLPQCVLALSTPGLHRQAIRMPPVSMGATFSPRLVFSELTLKVQRFLESWFNVPAVLIVLGGGPGTLRTVLAALRIAEAARSAACRTMRGAAA